MRLLYWWWIIKYGGKKNIPPEVLFGKIEETFAGLESNLRSAISVDDTVLDPEERERFLKITSLLNDMKMELEESEQEAKNAKNQ